LLGYITTPREGINIALILLLWEGPGHTYRGDSLDRFAGRASSSPGLISQNWAILLLKPQRKLVQKPADLDHTFTGNPR